jgi:hypothetical protein
MPKFLEEVIDNIETDTLIVIPTGEGRYMAAEVSVDHQPNTPVLWFHLFSQNTPTQFITATEVLELVKTTASTNPVEHVLLIQGPISDLSSLAQQLVQDANDPDVKATLEATNYKLSGQEPPTPSTPESPTVAFDPFQL